MNVITSIILSIGLIGALIYGFNRNEVIECNTWKSQASEYEGFYLTQWQSEQCSAHGIAIQAPVR